MKKTLKMAIKVLPIIIMIAIVIMPITFAAPWIGITEEVSTGTASLTKGMIHNVWGAIRTILQVAAVGALIFAGVRYMFASADQKADIKKSMGILVIGAVIVFGSTLVIQLIIKIAEDLTSTKVI